MSKICSKCKVSKSLTDFNWHTIGKKLHSYCKSCHKNYYLANKESILKKCKTRYKNNKLKRTQQNKRYYEKHKKTYLYKQKIRTLKKKYGITIEQFTSLLKQQNNTCAICKTADFKAFGPCVDHCHATGKIRGILCHNCNTALGLFKDKKDILFEAIKYLSG